VPRQVAGLAGRAAADALTELTPTRRATQEMAVSMCPELADHPEVHQYCLRPLALTLSSSAMQEELAESLPENRVSTKPRALQDGDLG